MTIFPVYTNLERYSVSIFPTSKSFARYETHILKKDEHDSKLGVADSYLCWTGEPVSQWEL